MYINAKVIVAFTKDNYDNNDKHYPLINIIKLTIIIMLNQTAVINLNKK